jgi:hypothetical protein
LACWVRVGMRTAYTTRRPNAAQVTNIRIYIKKVYTDMYVCMHACLYVCMYYVLYVHLRAVR